MDTLQRSAQIASEHPIKSRSARPQRSAQFGVDALTRAERRVAELAVMGRTNPEIAQSLFITRKTVEKHLGNAYLKLAISSRTELPAALGYFVERRVYAIGHGALRVGSIPRMKEVGSVPTDPTAS